MALIKSVKGKRPVLVKMFFWQITQQLLEMLKQATIVHFGLIVLLEVMFIQLKWATMLIFKTEHVFTALT